MLHISQKLSMHKEDKHQQRALRGVAMVLCVNSLLGAKLLLVFPHNFSVNYCILGKASNHEF